MVRTEGKITLVPIGNIQKWVLESLAEKLEKAFGCPTEIQEGMKLPEEAYNRGRNQYHSSQILERIHNFIKPGNKERVLAIADVDLYVHGLNFVFGEAELGGHFAIVSLTRLRQSFYGRPENKTLFIERTVKEAVHELGHVYGFTHCPDRDCVMHFSNSLMDTDRKKSSFCSRCQEELEKLSLRR
jgi:archaemetzincin